MTSAPEVGHVTPLLGLGQALRDAGHAVRVATHPDEHSLIAGAGLRPIAAGMSGQAMRQERVQRWPETRSQPPRVWAVRMFTAILAPRTLIDLQVECDEWQPDLLVHEEGEYAGPVAAARAGIPWVTHAWGSPLRPVDELRGLEADASSLWESVGLAVPQWGGLYRHGLLNPCPAALQPGQPAGALEWSVRPMQLPGSTDRSADGAGFPQVYIGFGTVPTFAEDEVALAAAVHACAARGLRTVVTTSDPGQAQSLAEIAPGLVTGKTFVSLTQVLPSCCLVVCHGGAGTVLAALAAGVPLVIVPKGTPSQSRMAAGCAAAGVAVVADPEHGGITAAIATVLDDHNFRDRAQELAVDIDRMATPADLVPRLHEIGSSSVVDR